MNNYSKWIHKFEIKPGKWVFVPSEKSIEIGTEIKSSLEKCWSPPSYFYHLQKGGHVKAIKKHLQSNSFIHLDIQDFYGSINKSRVTRCLKKYFGYEKARSIAVDSTVRFQSHSDNKYVLPFGFIQSPILASICLADSSLGRYLHKLYKQNIVLVSVYMDDFVLSTRKNIDLNSILSSFVQVSEKSKFKINHKKEEGPASKITAFNIDLIHKNISIEPERLHKFIEAYNQSSNPYQKKGIRRYVNSVNTAQANKNFSLVNTNIN